MSEIDWQEVYAESAHSREQIAVLIRRAEAAEARIAAHNEGCRQACSARGTCIDYTARGRMCPDCPQDWMIDDDATAMDRGEEAKEAALRG